jgi:hypothetical protein
MNLQFTLSRTWLWLITLAVALIITWIMASCWSGHSQAVRYQADTQRYDLIRASDSWAYLLDRRTGKAFLGRGFPEQTEE